MIEARLLELKEALRVGTDKASAGRVELIEKAQALIQAIESSRVGEVYEFEYTGATEKVGSDYIAKQGTLYFSPEVKT